MLLYTMKMRIATGIFAKRKRLIVLDTLVSKLSTLFGGDEGSRTPVRKTDTPGIYERSLCFHLAYRTPTNRITIDQPGKFPVPLPRTGETVVR